MIRKLYDWNLELGGTQAEDEEADRLCDPFINAADEVKETLGEIKKKQDRRNEIKKKQGNSLEAVKLTGEIKEFLDRADEQFDNLDEILRQQTQEGKMSPEEMEQKEKQKESFETLLSKSL